MYFVIFPFTIGHTTLVVPIQTTRGAAKKTDSVDGARADHVQGIVLDLITLGITIQELVSRA